MSSSDSLAFLQHGLVVPVSAVNLALRCEALGIVLSIAPDGRLAAAGPITDAIRAELRQHKQHLILLMRYTPDDRHLFDDQHPFPPHGPIVTRRPS